jgi:hypothetical protein
VFLSLVGVFKATNFAGDYRLFAAVLKTPTKLKIPILKMFCLLVFLSLVGFLRQTTLPGITGYLPRS